MTRNGQKKPFMSHKFWASPTIYSLSIVTKIYITSFWPGGIAKATAMNQKDKNL